MGFWYLRSVDFESVVFLWGWGIDWGSKMGFYVAQGSLKFAKHPWITLKWFIRCWWSSLELYAFNERTLPVELHPQPRHLCILHPLHHYLDLKLRYWNRVLNCFSCLFLLGMGTVNRHIVFDHNQTDISCEPKPQSCLDLPLCWGWFALVLIFQGLTDWALLLLTRHRILTILLGRVSCGPSGLEWYRMIDFQTQVSIRSCCLGRVRGIMDLYKLLFHVKAETKLDVQDYKQLPPYPWLTFESWLVKSKVEFISLAQTQLRNENDLLTETW